MKGVFTHEFRIRFSSLYQDLSRVVGKGIKTMKSFHVWVCGLWCSISASKWSAVLVLRERDSSAVINSACNCTNRLTFQLCRIFIRVQLTKETSSYCHPSLGVQLSFVMPKGSTLLRALTLYPPLWPTWWFHHLVKLETGSKYKPAPTEWCIIMLNLKSFCFLFFWQLYRGCFFLNTSPV